MSNITDLNPLSPTGNDPVSDGDNELRALKNALVGDGTAAEGSFTPSFTGQYTGTAAELNAVNTAIQPTDDLDALNDVTYSPDPPAVGDHLVYGASGWANETPAAPAPSPGSARYTGYAGKVTDQPYFTTEVRNTIPAALAIVKNDGNGGFGWTLTAVEDVLVTLFMSADYYLQYSDFGSSARDANCNLGVGLNTVGSSLDQSAGAGKMYLYQPAADSPVSDNTVWFPELTPNLTTSIVISATDFLTVSFNTATVGIVVSQTMQNMTLNLSVQPA